MGEVKVELEVENAVDREHVRQKFHTTTLQTLRNRILLMPVQLLRRGNRPRLAMPASGPRELAWKYALQNIERIKP